MLSWLVELSEESWSLLLHDPFAGVGVSGVLYLALVVLVSGFVGGVLVTPAAMEKVSGEYFTWL